MDLYIQIGLLFMLMTAFGAFAYIYGMPSSEFQRGASEEYTATANVLRENSGASLSQFHNKDNISGTQVLNLIKSAKSKGIFVLVGNRTSPHLFSGYGAFYAGATAPSDTDYSPLYENDSKNVPVLRAYDGVFTVAKHQYYNESRSGIKYIGKVSPVYTTLSNALFTLDNFNFNGNYTGTGNSIETPDLVPKIELEDYTVSTTQYRNGKLTLGGSKNIFRSGAYYTTAVRRDDLHLTEFRNYLDKNHAAYINPAWEYYSNLVYDLDGEVVGVVFEDTAIPFNNSYRKNIDSLRGSL